MSAASFIEPKHDDSQQRLQFKEATIISVGMGLHGNDIVDTTTNKTGNWWCLHALSDTVFTSVTYADGTSTGSLAGKSLAKGDRIYGQIKQFRLASGEVIAYRIKGV